MENEGVKETYNMTSNNASNPGWLDTPTSKVATKYGSFGQLSSTSSAILGGTKQFASSQSAATQLPTATPLHSTEMEGEVASGFVGPDAVSEMSLTTRMMPQQPIDGEAGGAIAATEWLLNPSNASIKHISTTLSNTSLLSTTNSTSFVSTPWVTTTLSEPFTTSLSPSESTTWAHWTTDGPLNHHGGPEPLGLLALLIITFLGNILVCLAVRCDKRLHTMTYYFFMSLGVMHLLMLATIMPPALFVLIAGSFNFSEDWCKVWVTLDLFFCNNTCLHLAFTNMDTFLRLKDPLRHGRIITTCSVVLWIGAPWMISFVQAIAQFMLSQGDHGIIHSGICYIGDKNFVILGTLFSFLIPTVISILFYIMCVFEIRSLKGGKFLDDSEASTHNIYRYASNESVEDENGSDTTSCVSETETLPREQVQLAVVTNMKSAEIKDCITRSPTNSIEETTAFCDEPGQEITTTSFADHILSTDQSASCTLLLRDAPHDDGENCLIRPNAEDDHDSPDEQLRHEQAISRLMFVHLILTISLWIPFSASNVVYGICPSCQVNMSFKQNMTFKWLAYSTAVIGPFLYGKFCDTVRDAYWRVVLCRYCCQRKRR